MAQELIYSKILYQIATAPLSSGLSYALDHCLKIIIKDLNYEIGHWYWGENRTDSQFEASKHWCLKDKKVGFSEFRLQSEQLIIEPTEVISGCFESLQNDTSKRMSISSATLFNSALYIPLQINNQYFGFLEFYSTKKIETTESLKQFCDLVSFELSRQASLIRSKEIEKQQVFQLAQASRLSSIGAMAGGIAHEINNPLTIIMGSLKLAIRAIESEDFCNNKIKTIEGLERARAHAERITKIVKGIRAMSRDGAHDPFVFAKIKDILEDTLNLCEAKIRTLDIRLNCDIQEDIVNFQCRPVQVSQVLLNLINNSLDAIGDLPDPWISLKIVKVADYLEFRITDSGPGIPEHIANQLMQPFFTTKGTGRGTGLGLSISQEIVKAHSGTFFLNRECPNTQFVVSFPIEQNITGQTT